MFRAEKVVASEALTLLEPHLHTNERQSNEFEHFSHRAMNALAQTHKHTGGTFTCK